MATTYTSSASSGNATSVSYYNQGPNLCFTGHYSAPNAATAIFETQMFEITEYYVQDADPTTFKFSANSNGTIAVLCSGLVAGSTGYFEFKGR